jgi:Flp pilus assembly protein TadD
MLHELIPGRLPSSLLAVLLPWLGQILTPLLAQTRSEHHEEAVGIDAWQLSDVPDTRPRRQSARAGTISAELLRYPLCSKARGMLRRALHMSETGDHLAAIQQLQEVLVKFPASAAYVHSLLGIEYLQTARVPDAVRSLEEAVSLLPHDPVNHANLGLSLHAAGQFERAQQEFRRALELDHSGSIAKLFLETHPSTKHSQN